MCHAHSNAHKQRNTVAHSFSARKKMETELKDFGHTID